ncbi:MAG: cyclic nucleotide-binding domain-containing protein [Myxococcota bacterium]
MSSLIGVPAWLLLAALRAAIWHALFVAAVTVAKSASNAVFLARAEPRSLPLLYVVVAVAVALTMWACTRLLRRFNARLVTDVAVTAGTVLQILILTGCLLGIRFAPAALYVVSEVWATTISVLFWSRIGEGFSPRDQRRVVGVLGGGGMAGAVVGGLAMRAVVQDLGALWPALLTASLPLAGLPLLSRLRTRRTGRASSSEDLRHSGGRYLLQAKYPLGVALLVIMLAAVGAATDFAFRLASAEAMGEVEMAGLFGLLNAAVGLLVVIVQLGLTSRLLGRFGVFAFLAIVPAGLCVLAIGPFVGAPLFPVMLSMKALEMAGAFSLYQAAVSLLYNPMPSSVRSQVRAIIDGAIKKSGAAIAGLSLAGLAYADRDWIGPWLPAGLALSVLALLPRLRAQYLRALEDKLGRRRQGRIGGSTIDASDRETRRLLLEALEREDPVVVLAALDALGLNARLSSRRLLALLRHDDERVRQAGLERVPRDEQATDELVTTLCDMVRNRGAQRPRGEAVRALARARPEALLALLEPLLDEDEPAVVCAAIEVGWGGPAHGLVKQRLDDLCETLPGHSPAWRREVARLIGSTDEQMYDGTLLGLMDDPDPSVWGRAAEAAGRERHEAHLPRLLAALGRREERAAAREALVRYGDLAVPMLSDALDDRGLPLTQRIHVPRVLSAIGTKAAAHALLFSNPRDDAYLQRRIADRLVELCTKHREVRVDRARCDEAVHRRLSAARAHGLALADLTALQGQGAGLLLRVVAERREMALRIALQLIGLHRGMDRAMTALRALGNASRQGDALRQDALELLDVHLTGDPLRASLLEVLEEQPVVGSQDAAERRVWQLTTSRDPLVRGIARRTVRTLSLTAPAEAVPQGLEDDLEGEDMADTLIERVFLLEHVDLFEGLPTDDLVAIAALAEELDVPPGGVVYREGDRGDCMYVIIAGELALTRRGLPVMTLHVGESLGQTSFLDRGPRPVTARATHNASTRLLVVQRGAFMDLLSDRPGLMHALFAVLGQRLRTLIERDAGGSH